MREEYKITDQPNGRRDHIKAVCIGAGATGLYLAYRMEQRMKNFDLTIYEKNDDIGGTWLESELHKTDACALESTNAQKDRYPGCSCDIPSHIYTYTFRAVRLY